MVSPEVAAALVSLGGSAVFGVGTTMANWWYNRKKTRGRPLERLRDHPLFYLHEDVELQISCYDPVRSRMFNYLKDYVIITPVQSEFERLLQSWTEVTLCREDKNVVCDRLFLCMDQIQRRQSQNCAEIDKIQDIMSRTLKPFTICTLRSVKDLARTGYDNCTLLTVAVGLVYASIFSIISEWSVSANMINGQLNNCTWIGERLTPSFDGSASTLIGHATRWIATISDFLSFGFTILDDKGNIVWISEDFERALGYHSHLIGRHWSTIKGNLDRKEILSILTKEQSSKWKCPDSLGDDMPADGFGQGQGKCYHGLYNLVDREGLSRPCCIATDNIAVTSLKEQTSRLHTMVAIDMNNEGKILTLEELNTLHSLIVRLIVLKYDGVISVSSGPEWLVHYRNETLPQNPQISKGIPLSVNLGVTVSELEAASDSSGKHNLGMLCYGALTYISKRLAYRCHIYSIHEYKLCLHIQEPNKIIEHSKSKKKSKSQKIPELELRDCFAECEEI